MRLTNNMRLTTRVYGMLNTSYWVNDRAVYSEKKQVKQNSDHTNFLHNKTSSKHTENHL